MIQDICLWFERRFILSGKLCRLFWHKSVSIGVDARKHCARCRVRLRENVLWKKAVA